MARHVAAAATVLALIYASDAPTLEGPVEALAPGTLA